MNGTSLNKTTTTTTTTATRLKKTATTTSLLIRPSPSSPARHPARSTKTRRTSRVPGTMPRASGPVRDAYLSPGSVRGGRCGRCCRGSREDAISVLEHEILHGFTIGEARELHHGIVCECTYSASVHVVRQSSSAMFCDMSCTRHLEPGTLPRARGAGWDPPASSSSGAWGLQARQGAGTERGIWPKTQLLDTVRFIFPGCYALARPSRTFLFEV